MAATIGFSIATASAPMAKATMTGAIRATSADRPEARVTTSSLLRASPRKSVIVDRIITSGRISLMALGMFSSVNCAIRRNPIPSAENRRSCSTRSISASNRKNTVRMPRKVTRNRRAK